MGIPVQGLYMSDEIGFGQVSRLENSSINSNEAAEGIDFGVAVNLDGKKVRVAKKAPIYGVAIRRSYTKSEYFDEKEVENDKWGDGEVVGVLRDGTVNVRLSGDVKQGETATIDANGLFKTAVAGDVGVGTFMSDGRSGKGAEVQIRVAVPTVEVTPSNPSNPSTPASTKTSNYSSKESE